MDPPVSRSAFGVLLMAYGTPRNADEIEPYYTDIRRGRKPSPELLRELTERYRLVGGGTPLLEISQAQADGLQRVLGPDFKVFLGMKHWHPYIRQAVEEMQGAGIASAVGIVLAPHYSRGSVGEYAERVRRAMGDLGYDLDITLVESWHLNPHYLRAVAAHVRQAMSAFGQAADVTLVFTAHSLPQKVVAGGDPYQDQMLETCRALAEVLDVPARQWTFTFQSAGRTPDPWLGPDILDTVNRLGDEGVTDILVVPIGFIADHLEIYYDIDIEAARAAQERGIHLERIQSLNDDPDLIAALAEIARSAHSTA